MNAYDMTALHEWQRSRAGRLSLDLLKGMVFSEEESHRDYNTFSILEMTSRNTSTGAIRDDMISDMNVLTQYIIQTFCVPKDLTFKEWHSDWVDSQMKE